MLYISQHIKSNLAAPLLRIGVWCFSLLLLVTSCARMAAPDGGWYDEKPPYVVDATPAENATDVTSRKISIRFNEYIKLENPSEKVIVSPAQKEQPEIKVTGKVINVNLLDSLHPNTTYTIDFSDAISDNNEGNPMGNYSYTFSTGSTIDTLQVSGYVLNAEDLEPLKGIIVALYPVNAAPQSTDVATTTTSAMPQTSTSTTTSAMQQVTGRIAITKTDSRGHFTIRGIAPGRYTIGAVMDADGNYAFSQRSELMAFCHDIISPTSMADTRQDTLWADANHIKDIEVKGYTHFYPDNITLRAFNHKLTDRYFLKAERKEPNRFTLYYTAPVSNEYANTALLPSIKLLSPAVQDPFFVEHSVEGDTITYWLRDTAMVNTDTLRLAATTYITDTTGIQRLQTDTLEILSKVPYAKRLKALQEKQQQWKKDLAKRLKKALPDEVIDTVMPREMLEPNYSVPSVMVPNGAVRIAFPTPLARLDTTAVHLYVEQDSLWYRAPFVIKPLPAHRQYELYTDWIPAARYSFEVDSLAFEDIYGNHNARYKAGITVSKTENYASLFVNVTYNAPASVPSSAEPNATVPGESSPGSILVQLLTTDTPIQTAKVIDGTAEFYYISPGTYYLRAIIDANNNGKWDTGDYYLDQQPEEVYYYHEAIECKAKWDLTKSWNLTSRPLNSQKPGAITKQKPEAGKTIKSRNADRARDKGIEIPARYR